MDKFSELLLSVFHIYDFVCLSETWMKTSEKADVDVKTTYVLINQGHESRKERKEAQEEFYCIFTTE